MAQSPLREMIEISIRAQEQFRGRWEPYDTDGSVSVDEVKGAAILRSLEKRLTENYPFFHPRYAGQMLKPPHDIAIAAYLMAMQINPNNHALDGGPATAKMEMEVVAAIARMFGYTQHIGHLTSSGTIANLEALWIAKSIHPDKAIAYSSTAHYTHQRMCDVIGAKHVRLDSFENLEASIIKHSIGTIVVTIGTTSTGEVEPLHTILPIARKHGVRIHADAAYGGFFSLLASDADPVIDPVPFRLLSECDSIVVDPHKHGLQPYGCGCILFKDVNTGSYYKHNSPYTYFTSADLHLGEISLECSRAGAAAAALWATLEYLPLKSDTGLGSILRKTRNAALEFSRLLSKSRILEEYVNPHLDINTYFMRTSTFSSTAVSTVTEKVFHQLMNRNENPVFLATLTVNSESVKKRFPEFIADSPFTKIFRSVFMKPEHAAFIPAIFSDIEQCCKDNF
ncbi:MAG: pyridoxal phosphate-dependent decarboxylase family protein [Bacteroidota bacterium]